MSPRGVSALAVSLALGVLALLAVACAGTPRRPPLTEDAYPGALVDSAALPDGVFLRQRIEARFGGRSASFAAVLQVDGGVLSLLALTPYGTRAFLLEQVGQSVRFTRYVDRELPFPPRFILVDVHRALFAGLGQPPPSALVEHRHEHTHERAFVREGERVTELWREGRLFERRFERLDGEPAGVIRARYPDGVAPGALPARIELDNGWFGYQLSIRTLP